MASKILLISADKKLEKTMNEHIKDHSFSLSVLHSSSGVSSKIKKDKPDIIMLDLALPKTDGWEILKELQSKKTTAKLPVVIVDQRSSHKNEVEAFENGAASYTSKSAPAELLLQKLYSIQALAMLKKTNKKPIDVNKV